MEVRPSAAPLMRAAGAAELAPELRVWRVRVAALPGLRRAGILVRAEHERLFLRTTSVLDTPTADSEWWRTAIGADVATPPGPGKPVTIVDSGLDITHEEFASRPNTTLLNDQTTFFEEDDHGTEVASVIGATVGMMGVYPQAVLRSYDASPFGFITAGDAVRGIVAATRGGPGAINLSFGGEEDDPLVHLAVLYAFKHGSLVVASSGNDGLAGNPLSYPASYPHVLTIGVRIRRRSGATHPRRGAGGGRSERLHLRVRYELFRAHGVRRGRLGLDRPAGAEQHAAVRRHALLGTRHRRAGL